MLRVPVGVFLLLAGCLKPELQTCGDLVCPPDAVCLSTGRCATRESIDACNGVTEGMPCTTSLFTGSCIAGVCTASRCGDGMVSGSEQCDGSVSGVDCVDYGFDTGVPTCSERCGLDVVRGCVKFGWDRMQSTAAAHAWTNGSLLARIDGAHVEISRDGQELQSADAPGNESFYSLAGNGSTVVANTYSHLLRSDNGGAFTEVSMAGLPNAYITVQLADDGTIYAGANLFDDHFEIYESTPTGWRQIQTTTPLATTFKWTGGALYVGYTDHQVFRYLNGSWSTALFTASEVVQDITDVGDILYFTLYNGGAFKFANDTQTPLSMERYSSVAATPSGVFFGGNGVVARWGDSKIEAFAAPIYGYVFTDGTDLYMFGGSGIYRFTGTAWSLHVGIGEPVTDFAVLGDGRMGATTTSQVYTEADPSSWYYNTISEPPLAIAGAAYDDFYVAGSSTMVHFDGVGPVPVTLPANIPPITDVAWDTNGGLLYVVGKAGFGMMGTSGAWTRFTDVTGCDLHAITLGASAIYATGTCGTEGVVWSLSGTSWLELHRGLVALDSLAVDSSDNIYAAGSGGGVTRIAGTWQDEPLASGVSISATGPSDIWVGGGSDDILHYDGTAWSRVAITGAARPHVVATPHAVYIAGGFTSILVR